MLKFNTKKINAQILDQWISANANVLLIGEKGVGKSMQILDSFKRNELKFSYFSGATLDPWVHILGIPTVSKQAEGANKVDFALPESMDTSVEAIFIDEFNRCHRTVRNALLELLQFKTINGRSFPNLRMIWAAVNPKNEQDYDVDELDPAQLDRFHIICEIPNAPDMEYFSNKYGKERAKLLIEWWKMQPEEALKILSPRRLEYVADFYDKGLDISALLPVSANHTNLIKMLSMEGDDIKWIEAIDNFDDAILKELFSNNKLVSKFYKKLCFSEFYKYWKNGPSELRKKFFSTNTHYQDYVITKSLLSDEPEYKSMLSEECEAKPNSNLIDVLKIMHKSIKIKPSDDFLHYPANNDLNDAKQHLNEFLEIATKYEIINDDNIDDVDSSMCKDEKKPLKKDGDLADKKNHIFSQLANYIVHILKFARNNEYIPLSTTVNKIVWHHESLPTEQIEEIDKSLLYHFKYFWNILDDNTMQQFAIVSTVLRGIMSRAHKNKKIDGYALGSILKLYIKAVSGFSQECEESKINETSYLLHQFSTLVKLASKTRRPSANFIGDSMTFSNIQSIIQSLEYQRIPRKQIVVESLKLARENKVVTEWIYDSKYVCGDEKVQCNYPTGTF